MLNAQAIAKGTIQRVSQQPQTPPKTLTDFKRMFWNGYDHVAHQQAIDNLLMQIADYVQSGGQRGIGRAIINMPPRHGKTQTVSKLFPAYMLSRYPDMRLIMASYGATLAKNNSRFVRNLINSAKYQQLYPHIKLASDSQAVDTWDISGYAGGAIAAGVGGGITGHGGNLIIVDDPIKNRAEAESATYREKLKSWFTDDLLTRLEEPGGAIVLMNTRWHMDDLAGWLLSDDDTNEWRVLSLPAIAGDNDPLGREPGAALWPDRYPLEILEKRQVRMGAYAFESLYQQSPLPPGGGLFDTAHIEIVEYPPECTQVVRFYDLAVTAKRTADYTVGLKLGVTADEEFIVFDVWRAQRELPDVHEAIVQNAAMDGKDVHIRLEAEKAGVVQLQYLLRDNRMRPYVIDAVPPQGDKYTRAAPVAARANAARLKLVRGVWNRAFIDELSVFPSGTHDDQVDALSGAYEMLDELPKFFAY